MTPSGRAALIALATVSITQTAPAAAEPQSKSTDNNAMNINIRIVAGDTEIPARLEDSPAARDFAALLPLALTLRDYHGIEKVADLPRRLSTQDAPDGIDPAIGDITYYAPWGNLAIFYRDFGYSRGLVRLGRIEDGVAQLGARDNFEVRIERVDDPS